MTTDPIRFTIPGPPIAKGRPRAFRCGNGVRMHTPAKTLAYESLVAEMAAQAMKGRVPFDGPMAVQIEAFFAPPKSWSTKRRHEAFAGCIAPTKKPDPDNIIKAILDGCNDVLYVDDNRVVDVVLRKWYSERPRVEVAARCTYGRLARRLAFLLG